jgi:hypothetical protein
MNKKLFLIASLVLFFLPIQLFSLYYSLSNNSENKNVAGIINQRYEVENSVFIGEYHFTLFGYTSPLAEVSFSGQGIADQTIADETGYFEFKNRFSPFSPREACLSAKDQFGRLSVPVCLPPFPTQYNVTIGPVILPPTISLDKSTYFIGDEVILTGQTIPNKKISLSVFTDESKNKKILTKIFSIIKPVEAFSLPKLTTVSDDKGNFSISLPSSSAKNYRLFTQVKYENNNSNNSLTLSVKVLPVWMIVIKFFIFLWSFVKNRLLELVIVLEIFGLLVYFLRTLVNPYHLSKSKAIVLYQSKLPVVEEKHPLVKY